jgi:hypothetical protein
MLSVRSPFELPATTSLDNAEFGHRAKRTLAIYHIMRVFWPTRGVTVQDGCVVGWKVEDVLVVVGILKNVSLGSAGRVWPC